MRIIVLFLLILPFANASQYDGIEWLESTVDSNPATGKIPQLGDVIPGHDLNPYAWPPAAPVWGTQEVLDWRIEGLNEATVRHLATLAGLGAGDIYPDPLRGDFSLLGEMRAQHEHLVGGAVLAWHLWGLQAAGVPEDDSLRVIDEANLMALQLEDGSVPCNPNYGEPSVDCTAWAVIAMGGRNEQFHAAGTDFLMSHFHENGGFGIGEPNLQASIWAGVAVGFVYNSLTEDYVSRLQGADGRYHCVNLETACGHVWATAEAVAFIGGTYPLQHQEPPVIEGPLHLMAGETGVWSASEEVVWHVNDQTFTGTQLELPLQDSTTMYAQGAGWARLHVTVESPQESPALPLLFAVGALCWAGYRRK